MSFETTTCISYEHYAKLFQYAKKYNCSLSSLITLLLRYIAHYQKIPFLINSRVQYRDRKTNTNWKRVHVMVRPYDYEILLDLKKLCKMSVAKMIDYGVENLFYEFVANVLEKQKTDNYLYANYHYEFSDEENILGYHVYWGLPLHIMQKIIKNKVVLQM